MKISTAKREYLVEIEVRKYTPKSIRSYRNNLNLFCAFVRSRRGKNKRFFLSRFSPQTRKALRHKGLQT